MAVGSVMLLRYAAVVKAAVSVQKHSGIVNSNYKELNKTVASLHLLIKLMSLFHNNLKIYFL